MRNRFLRTRTVTMIGKSWGEAVDKLEPSYVAVGTFVKWYSYFGKTAASFSKYSARVMQSSNSTLRYIFKKI